MVLPDNPWAVAVGTFVLAFGDIEHTTIALLGCLPTCKMPLRAPRMRLQQRFDVLKIALAGSDGVDFVETLVALQTVENLVVHRNLLAHNGVWFDIYQDGDELLLRSALVSARDRTLRLTLPEVESLAQEAHKGAAAFSMAAVSLMKQFVPEDYPT